MAYISYTDHKLMICIKLCTMCHRLVGCDMTLQHQHTVLELLQANTLGMLNVHNTYTHAPGTCIGSNQHPFAQSLIV